MRKITLPWNHLFDFVKNNYREGITRVCLCYKLDDLGHLDKSQPYTIVDHLMKNNGEVEKEGIEINLSGNPLKLDYYKDIIYVPR